MSSDDCSRDPCCWLDVKSNMEKIDHLISSMVPKSRLVQAQENVLKVAQENDRLWDIIGKIRQRHSCEVSDTFMHNSRRKKALCCIQEQLHVLESEVRKITDICQLLALPQDPITSADLSDSNIVIRHEKMGWTCGTIQNLQTLASSTKTTVIRAQNHMQNFLQAEESTNKSSMCLENISEFSHRKNNFKALQREHTNVEFLHPEKSILVLKDSLVQNKRPIFRIHSEGNTGTRNPNVQGETEQHSFLRRCGAATNDMSCCKALRGNKLRNEAPKVLSITATIKEHALESSAFKHSSRSEAEALSLEIECLRQSLQKMQNAEEDMLSAKVELESIKAEHSRTQRLLRTMVSKKVKYDSELAEMQHITLEVEGLHSMIQTLIDVLEKSFRIVSSRDAYIPSEVLGWSRRGEEVFSHLSHVSQYPSRVMERGQSEMQSSYENSNQEFTCGNPLQHSVSAEREVNNSEELRQLLSSLEEIIAFVDFNNSRAIHRVKMLEDGIISLGTSCCAEFNTIRQMIQDAAGSAQAEISSLLDLNQQLQLQVNQMVPAEWLERAEERILQRESEIERLKFRTQSRQLGNNRTEGHTLNDGRLTTPITTSLETWPATAAEPTPTKRSTRNLSERCEIAIPDTNWRDEDNQDWLEAFMHSMVPKDLFESAREELEGKVADNEMLRKCLHEMARKEELATTTIEMLRTRLLMAEHLSGGAQSDHIGACCRGTFALSLCSCSPQHNAQKHDVMIESDPGSRTGTVEDFWNFGNICLRQGNGHFAGDVSWTDLDLARDMIHDAKYCKVFGEGRDYSEVLSFQETDNEIKQLISRMKPKEWLELVRCHAKRRDDEIDRLKEILESMAPLSQLNALRLEKHQALQEVERLQQNLKLSVQSSSNVAGLQVEIEGLKLRVARMQKQIDSMVPRVLYDELLADGLRRGTEIQNLQACLKLMAANSRKEGRLLPNDKEMSYLLDHHKAQISSDYKRAHVSGGVQTFASQADTRKEEAGMVPFFFL